MSFRLAACAEMLYLDRPFIERVRRIADRGFEVEIWDWSTKDVEALASAGATISSMTGYLRGELTTDEGAAALIETAALSIQVARRLGVPRLNLHGTGLGADGLPVAPRLDIAGTDWLTAADTLGALAAMGEEAGVVFTLENLNTAVDHPGTPFARAADTLALVSAVDHPALRLNLDLYHAQIGEGNLIELLRRAIAWVGEVQVADVPGRREPGTGEIRFPAIAAELRALGYDGVVALEAWASRDSDAALDAFEDAFRLD